MQSSPLRRRVLLLFMGVTAALALATMAPRFSDLFWLLELPAHFRAHLSVGAAVVVVALTLLRAWPQLVFATAVAAFLAAPVIGLWIPSDSASQNGVPLRVLSLNVSFYSRNYDDVIELLQNLRPDVVGLVEINTRWVEELAPIDDVYPHRSIYARRRGSGVALLSQIPFEGSEIRSFPGTDRHFAVATLNLDGHPLAVALAHGVSPLGGKDQTKVRDQQLQTLGAVRDEFPHHELIVMGDFNTSPWSLAFRRLVGNTRLRNAAAGFGYLPTWPVQRLWLGIPIDHHLVSDGIIVNRFSTVGPTGSDHLAVYTELSLR